MCFMSQSFWTNSVANQSSNSGCVGGSPCPPRSSSRDDKPVPKNNFHIRFTYAREVSGFSASIIHFARSSRFARASSSRSLVFGKNAGTAGSTSSPESSNQLPRGRIRVMRGFSVSVTSMVLIDFSTLESRLRDSSTCFRRSAVAGAMPK